MLFLETPLMRPSSSSLHPIELYFWKTPNGMKPLIALEELKVPYTLKMINIGKGEQFDPEFLKIAPNNRIPALSDPNYPLTLFESGAILLYLAETYGPELLSPTPHTKHKVYEWLFWQMGGLGPMAAQKNHFKVYAPKIFNTTLPYAIDRYVNEVLRLYGVMDTCLASSAYLAGAHYSIADIACFPWVYEDDVLSFEDFPHLKRWHTSIKTRKATIRAEEAAEKAILSYQAKHGKDVPDISNKESKKRFGHQSRKISSSKDKSTD